MVDRLGSPVSGNTLLLFGPQALSFGQDFFLYIRSTLLEEEGHRWILDTISELPRWHEIISKECGISHVGDGKKLLEDLNHWFEDGKLPQTSFKLPNTLLNPLVIITHLTQYHQYLRLANRGSKEIEDVYTCRNLGQETLGFCTGFLSALVVSNSANREEFARYGAVALRIGMLIGMIVDSRDRRAETGESVSLATIWSSPGSEVELAQILRDFPEVSIIVTSMVSRRYLICIRRIYLSDMMRIEPQ